MFNEYEIRALPLTIKSSREKVQTFLKANNLRLDNVDSYFGVFRIDEDEMLAGGGLCGGIIKCLAVSDELRNTGMSLRLISHLISTANSNGFTTVKVFTKPDNQTIFQSAGFHTLATSEHAILMENGLEGLNSYCRYLHGLRREGTSGIIIMNANPFTIGHRYLIEQASQQVDNLYVIVVKEDKSQFSYIERLAMITKGCGDLNNVVVCEGSDYAISAATFPTYFLKKIDDATDTHICLDLDIFIKHIAPALQAKIRFVGEETADQLTKRYNQLMEKILPAHGIKVISFKRLCKDNQIVSASTLRSFLNNAHLTSAIALAHPTTIPYLFSMLATIALQKELDTTPKPGLVDINNCGAHQDMDYQVMQNSINTLHPYFTKLSLYGFDNDSLEIERIREIGLQAEKAMLNATNGINTHKGALFSLGLVTAVAANIYHIKKEIKAQDLRDNISRLAKYIHQPSDTHGYDVTQKHDVKGALENAKMAYPQLFEQWLPYYKEQKGEEFAAHKTLLYIMSSLDDTNIYYRKGDEVAKKVREESSQLLNNFTPEALSDMNIRYSKEGISPGGSADMLALTIYIDALST